MIFNKYNDLHNNFYRLKNKNLKNNNLNKFQYLIYIIRNIIPLNIRNYICCHFSTFNYHNKIVHFEKVSIKNS